MHIWVDADACPVVVKDILFRAAERLQMQVTLVANKPLRTPPSRDIKAVRRRSARPTGMRSPPRWIASSAGIRIEPDRQSLVP